MHIGTMRTLEDLAKLKNLASAHISLQEIEDLSPLAKLPRLEYVDIRHNPVTDLSPLQNARALTELCVFGTQTETYAPLAACPRLQIVDAGGTPVSSLSQFVDIANLAQLYLRKTVFTHSHRHRKAGQSANRAVGYGDGWRPYAAFEASQNSGKYSFLKRCALKRNSNWPVQCLTSRIIRK